jgi:hypothetical protein
MKLSLAVLDDVAAKEGIQSCDTIAWQVQAMIVLTITFRCTNGGIRQIASLGPQGWSNAGTNKLGPRNRRVDLPSPQENFL